MSNLGERFESYATEVTDIPVTWGALVATQLPHYLASRYAVHKITVDGWEQRAIALIGNDIPSPTTLAKQVAQLAKLANIPPNGFCLVAEELPPYLRRRLVQLKLPFVIPGRQVYWPGLGVWQTSQRARRLAPKPVETLRPATQQLLIAALLKRLPEPSTIQRVAKRLGYSAMSVSRSLKDLEGAGLASSLLVGRERTVRLTEFRDQIWTNAQAMLASPVTKRIRVLRRDLPKAVATVAGESALARYSQLMAPTEPVFAIASRTWNRDFAEITTIPSIDDGTCQVELWRYAPEPLSKDQLADPLSVFLSLREHDDERVQIALREMMEDIPW